MTNQVPNQEPGSLNLIPCREPRNQKFQNQVPNQEPGTELASSGLNFLGQQRSNWLNREDTVFLQEVTGFSQEFTGFH